MSMLKTKVASQIDNDGYFVGTCIVNKDPMSQDEDAYILPHNVINIAPPENLSKINTRYKYNKESNSWNEEIDTSSFFRYKDRLFSASQLDIGVVRLLLDMKLEQYTILDVENKPITLTFLELIDLKTMLARKIMLMRGYYNMFSEKEKEAFKDLIILKE